MGNRYAQTGEEGYYYTPSPQIKALPQSQFIRLGQCETNVTPIREYPA